MGFGQGGKSLFAGSGIVDLELVIFALGLSKILALGIETAQVFLSHFSSM